MTHSCSPPQLMHRGDPPFVPRDNGPAFSPGDPWYCDCGQTWKLRRFAEANDDLRPTQRLHWEAAD